jgi:hypothetical protein
VSVSRANSSNRDRSADERASREISNPKIAPTSPRQTRDTNSRNPSRPCAVRPERPRSQSITSTALRAQPNATASSARAYCRAVDSVLSRTCARLDWRTYTIAARSRCDAWIFDRLLTRARLQR